MNAAVVATTPASPVPHAGNHRLVLFALDRGRYALRADTVARVVRMVEITPLPQAPEIVLGVVNVGGAIVPVVNVRRCFGLPEREISPDDHLVLARTRRRTVALVTDEVIGLTEVSPANIFEARAILPGLAYVEGVVQLADGLLFIHDLETFLSLEEERALTAALSLGRSGP